MYYVICLLNILLLVIEYSLLMLAADVIIEKIFSITDVCYAQTKQFNFCSYNQSNNNLEMYDDFYD